MSPAAHAAAPHHLPFLAHLFQLWAAFCAIAGVAVLAFAISAGLIALDPGAEHPGTEVAAGLTAGTLSVLGLAALLWATLHVLCGRGLLAHRPWARVLALALAVCDVVLVPLGTAIGIYAVWILLDESVRRLFTAPHAPAPS